MGGGIENGGVYLLSRPRPFWWIGSRSKGVVLVPFCAAAGCWWVVSSCCRGVVGAEFVVLKERSNVLEEKKMYTIGHPFPNSLLVAVVGVVISHCVLSRRGRPTEVGAYNQSSAVGFLVHIVLMMFKDSVPDVGGQSTISSVWLRKFAAYGWSVSFYVSEGLVAAYGRRRKNDRV